MEPLILQAKAMHDSLIEIRRAIHRCPEIGFQEHRTSQFIRTTLQSYGIDILPLKQETGVVGIIEGKQPGRVVALRADIDALPVQEENDVSYQSQNPGVMHACGHDAHIACLLGAARLLMQRRSELKGTVKLLFQPGEELFGGAQSLIDQGVFTAPNVDVIFGLHTKPDIPAGKIAFKSGPLMAAVDVIRITIQGKGGHGAMPHTTRDPIVAAAAIIQGVQTIVSRQVNPLDAVVISFGSIHGGEANNVIPEKVEIWGTVRTFCPQLRSGMPERLRSMVTHIAAAMNTEVDLMYRHDLPAVINPENLQNFCRQSLEKVVGAEGLVAASPCMGGEDFAIYQQQTPGVYFWLGTGSQSIGMDLQWHHPKFDIDEGALPYGAAALSQLTLDYLQEFTD